MTIKGTLATVFGVVVAWLSVMTGAMFFSDAAPAAVVIFPSERVMAELGGVSILAANNVSITVQSSEKRFARRLYQSGAFLVLPAGLTGCLPLPKQGLKRTK
jgi:hypothetical protein